MSFGKCFSNSLHSFQCKSNCLLSQSHCWQFKVSWNQSSGAKSVACNCKKWMNIITNVYGIFYSLPQLSSGLHYIQNGNHLQLLWHTSLAVALHKPRVDPCLSISDQDETWQTCGQGNCCILWISWGILFLCILQIYTDLQVSMHTNALGKFP